MRILVVGDIVGSPGRRIFARTALLMKEQQGVDVIVANAENAAAGRGVTPRLAEELFEAGADVLTLGDHTWDQKELPSYLDREPRIIRPANFDASCPGRGATTVQTTKGPLTVINLIGRVFMNEYNCPFRKADEILKGLPAGSGPILVDMHAEATSEKIAMGRHLDGRVTAVWGTHTHVQTSDETILPRGTGYITDLGMTGPSLSVLGRDHKSVLQKFLTGMPTRFDIEKSTDPVLEGILLEIDDKNGRLKTITRVREPSTQP
jgi:metallophosphoesterase (TIGR00282 family)